MFHSLFSRFPQVKALVFRDVKELNEEHMYLFTMTAVGTIVHLTAGNSKRHAFLWISPGHSIRLSSKALFVCDIFGPIGQWHHSWVSPLSDTPKLWYLLPINYTHSKDTWIGLSTDIVSWLDWTNFFFTQLHRAQYSKYKNLTAGR